MKLGHRTLVLSSLATFIVLATIDCGDDDTNPGPGAADASLDVSSGSEGGKVEAAADAPASDTGATDTGSPDTGSGDAGSDATPTDAGTDADADAGPLFDDAGCPLSTGPLPDLSDAGFPTNGLVLWLRGDRGVATVDGGTVCRWDDMSGNGRSFTPATSSAPVLAPTGLRNRPAVQFVGNRPMTRSDVLGIAATSGRTIAIFQALTDTTHRFSFYQGNFATNDIYFGIDQNTFQGDAGHEGVYIHGNAYEANIATTGAPRSHIYSIPNMTPNGALPALLTYAVDNVGASLLRTAGGTGNSKVWDFSSASRTSIGVSNASFTGGFIGEILVFDRELSAGERTTVHQYFQTHFPP